MSAPVNINEQFLNGFWSTCSAAHLQRISGQTVHWNSLANELKSEPERQAKCQSAGGALVNYFLTI